MKFYKDSKVESINIIQAHSWIIWYRWENLVKTFYHFDDDAYPTQLDFYSVFDSICKEFESLWIRMPMFGSLMQPMYHVYMCVKSIWIILCRQQIETNYFTFKCMVFKRRKKNFVQCWDAFCYGFTHRQIKREKFITEATKCMC